jgi:hypothetical protein
VSAVDYTDFVAEIAEFKVRNPNWRVGQTAFNRLRIQRPDLAQQVFNNAELDPYYNDERLPAFYAWVEEHWES